MRAKSKANLITHLKDTFMGFHCGNTASTKLAFCSMKYQMIMARTLPEEVTQGTLEGDIVPGDITFYRLQSTSDAKLRGYIAEGEVLPVATTFLRKHRYLRYSGDGQILPSRTGREKLSASRRSSIRTLRKSRYSKYSKCIGVEVDEIGYNQPKGVRYPTENPWG